MNPDSAPHPGTSTTAPAGGKHCAPRTGRQRLAALLLLCTAALAGPQALAQNCGPDITLPADQWTLVGVPCTPGANSTIADIFGPSLNAADYAVTWIAWKRIYDAPSQCAVASGPADCYIKLTLADQVNAGDAFWIYTTVEVELDMSSVGASATAGPYFQFPGRLSPDGNSRYYMFANPYEATVEGPDLRFSTLLFGFIPYLATAQQAVDSSIISRNAHYWNGNTYFTEDLTTSAATFHPKEAAWLEFLQPNPLVIPGVDVRVLDPTSP